MRTLKRGISLFTTSTPGEYFLGTPTRALRIYTSEQKVIAQHLANGVGEDEVAAQAGVSEIAVHNLLTEFSHLGLIDTSQGSITLRDRFISKINNRASKNNRPTLDGAYLQLNARIAPELHQSTWIDGVTDGGVRVLSERQNYLVEITGGNRVATLLYSLLLSSGVTQARFTPAARGRNQTIGNLDIGVDGITSAHYGFSFTDNREQLRRDYSLFPLEKGVNYLDEASTPDLVIACGDIDPEKLSLWMSYGQTFLHIPHPLGSQAEIGPLVLPGKSPCLRCAELGKRDQSGIYAIRSMDRDENSEYPHVAAHAVAAIAAAGVLNYLDALTLSRAHSSLIGSRIVLNYLEVAQPQVVAIARHPLCGCAFQ